MKNYEMFDRWVAMNDDDVEATELSKVAVHAVDLLAMLLGDDVARGSAQRIVEVAINEASDPELLGEASECLAQGDFEAALIDAFSEVDLLSFEFAQKANTLKCYAMTGMLEYEQPGDAYDSKLAELQSVLAWAETVCAVVPEDRQPLPSFRSLTSAARARLAIDCAFPLDIGDFSHLAALFREGSPEQVRKTIQNQVSARQLSVNEKRELLPESALLFLKGTPTFPSLWMLPEQSELDREEQSLSDPVFIPVGYPTSAGAETLFLPSQRHADGFHVGAGDNARVIPNFWEALGWLSVSVEPAFTPVGASAPVKCREEWLRIDRASLQSEIEAQKTSSSSLSLTDQIHAFILAQEGIQTHQQRHTSKMFRYKKDSGVELALERRIGQPWLYVSEASLPEPEWGNGIPVSGTRVGRNHHLNTLTTFDGQPLRKFAIRSTSDVSNVLAVL